MAKSGGTRRCRAFRRPFRQMSTAPTLSEPLTSAHAHQPTPLPWQCQLPQKWYDQHWKGGALARDMKNRVRVFGFGLQHLDCVDGGQDKQFDFVTLGFALYFLHDGQSTVCSTADNELVALPGDFFFYRERRVA